MTTRMTSQPLFRSLLIGGLLVGNLLPMATPSYAKARHRQEALPFLPPVATINGKLDSQQTGQDEDNSLDAVALSAVSAPVLKAGSRITKLDSTIGVRPEKEVEAILKLQQKLDNEDLDKLWAATVEKNPVIRFSLEKIMTPVDLHSKKSSQFLSKTLSTLIQGAALGSQMLYGGGGYQNMGIMTTAQALDNIVTGRNKAPLPGAVLTPTEQIQLAGLIDELKSKLLQSYHGYKNTLELLAEARQTTIKNNNLYSKALSSKNNLSIMAASAAYYQALSSEAKLRQSAKLCRLQLERLAGVEAVNQLQLAVAIPSDLRSASATVSTATPTEKLLKKAPIPESTPLQAPVEALLPSLNPPEDSLPPSPEVVMTPASELLNEATPSLPANLTPLEDAITTTDSAFIGPSLELAPDILPYKREEVRHD